MNLSIARSSVVAGLFTCALSGTALFAVDAGAAQTITTNYAGDPHWIHIDQPNVTQAQTFLPIYLYRDDRIWLSAGGCAQTGGSGATWKRYVNPSGPNSFALYHGQIQVPGAVGSLTNLDQLVGSTGGWSRMFVSDDPGFFAGQISIGYTDDSYGDNGYWGHDNGTENQCLGVGNAWLDVYVCYADPAHGPTC